MLSHAMCGLRISHLDFEPSQNHKKTFLSYKKNIAEKKSLILLMWIHMEENFLNNNTQPHTYIVILKVYMYVYIHKYIS